VVVDGWVTVSGQVQWGFQKTVAENPIRHLMGVKGVIDNIKVVSPLKVADLKRKTEDAFKRQAVLDAKAIEIRVDSATFTLDGYVHTWQEHEDAARAAWAAPGVGNVNNHLLVQ